MTVQRAERLNTMKRNSSKALLNKPRLYSSPVEIPHYLSFCGAQLQQTGTRSHQEDSFAFANISDVTLMRERGLLAVVADGMGGMKDGKLASESAIARIKADFEQLDIAGDIPAQLRASMVRANDEIFAALGAQGGSTGIICVFYRSDLYYASVGDSFLILKRGDSIYHLNRKQNMFTRLCLMQIREGSVDRHIAEGNPEKAALTGYLGMRELADIDALIRPLPLLDGDVILICSDGVGGVLGDQKLFECLSAPTPTMMCRKMHEAIVAAGRRYQDNYTALVVRCEY